MAEPRHWHIILYDVRDDGRLRRTHKVLSGWGASVQYSAFRVRCTARELERLRFELAEVLEADDALTIIRLCPSCAQHVSVRGKSTPGLVDDEPPYRIV